VPLRIFVAHASSLLTDHRPHGDGLVAFGFIQELAARGHELHVAVERTDLQKALPQNVHLYVLGPAEGGTARARLRFMWRMRGLYGRLERTTKFDVIHQLNPVDAGLSLALADARAPVVLGPYPADWPPSGQGADRVLGPVALRLRRFVRAAQQRCATTALLSTPAAASKLEAVQHVHVRELAPAVDDRAWVPAERDDRQDVLFLANLEARKGIHVLIEAFARLSAELPRARLLLGGGGPEEEAVQRRVQGLRARDRVTRLGPIERGRVPGIMQACDVYCLPSYGEPFGMTALEAMACARPVVGTDAGGLRYLIPEAGGRKVPPGDVAALALALTEVLTDPALRRSMGRHNRAVVEQRYSRSRVVDRLEDLYHEAIQTPPGGLRPAR
jgi:glycosyltransferase involved in cell wall biosynthesis